MKVNQLSVQQSVSSKSMEGTLAAKKNPVDIDANYNFRNTIRDNSARIGSGLVALTFLTSFVPDMRILARVLGVFALTALGFFAYSGGDKHLEAPGLLKNKPLDIK